MELKRKLRAYEEAEAEKRANKQREEEDLKRLALHGSGPQPDFTIQTSSATSTKRVTAVFGSPSNPYKHMEHDWAMKLR